MAFNTYNGAKSEKWKLPLRCHFGLFIEIQLTGAESKAERGKKGRATEVGFGGVRRASVNDILVNLVSR